MGSSLQLYLVVILCLVPFWAGISQETSTTTSFLTPLPSIGSKVPEGRSDEALWGFYIYMAADNSLSDEAHLDLNEMLRVGSRPGLLEIVTLTDYKYESNDDGYKNGTTRAYHVERNHLNQIPLNRVNASWNNEADMSDSESLFDFLTWALQAYPAQNKVLVIWNHGKGWVRVAQDHSSSLTMGGIRDVLERVDENFSMIAFDACEMAQLEVVHMFAPYTDFVLGSQAEEPDFGWTYDTMLGVLINDQDIEEDELASGLVGPFVESYRNKSRSTQLAVTYSAFEVDGLAAL